MPETSVEKVNNNMKHIKPSRKTNFNVSNMMIQVQVFLVPLATNTRDFFGHEGRQYDILVRHIRRVKSGVVLAVHYHENPDNDSVAINVVIKIILKLMKGIHYPVTKLLSYAKSSET